MSWDFIGGPLKRADWAMLGLILAISDISAAVAFLQLLPEWLTG